MIGGQISYNWFVELKKIMCAYVYQNTILLSKGIFKIFYKTQLSSSLVSKPAKEKEAKSAKNSPEKGT